MTAPQVAVHLVITRRNRVDAIRWNLESALSQTYRDLRVTCIDDASVDASRSVIENLRVTVPQACPVSFVFNEHRHGVIANILSAVRDDEDDTVVVLLDGDDALATPSAIERIAQEYAADQDTWFTYGSFLSWPDRKIIYGGPYHPLCISENRFREWFWRCAPPRSFRVGLLRAVPDSYFRGDDGKHWELACDQGLCLPMLELARWHLKHIPDVLYFYDPWNWTLPGMQRRRAAQSEEVAMIRAKPALPALVRRSW